MIGSLKIMEDGKKTWLPGESDREKGRKGGGFRGDSQRQLSSSMVPAGLPPLHPSILPIPDRPDPNRSWNKEEKNEKKEWSMNGIHPLEKPIDRLKPFIMTRLQWSTIRYDNLGSVLRRWGKRKLWREKDITSATQWWNPIRWLTARFCFVTTNGSSYS